MFMVNSYLFAFLLFSTLTTFAQITKSGSNNSKPDINWSKLPVRDEARINALPKEILSAEQLIKEISTYKLTVEKSISPAAMQEANSFIKSAKDDALAISRSAIVAWYKNSPSLALYLSLKAAELNAEEPEILNTAGAILNLQGFEHKALPLLQYLYQEIPDNSTVLNNIGQSYFGLGEMKLAEEFFLKCIAQEKHHTEANKSLGMMYMVAGKITQARVCFQNSLKGGYSETAYAGAEKAGDFDPMKIYEEVANRYGKIGYFNSYEYRIPRLPEEVTEVPELQPKHWSFRFKLETEGKQYEQLYLKSIQNVQKRTKEFVQKQTSSGVTYVTSPLMLHASRIIQYYQFLYVKQLEAQPHIISSFHKKKEAVDKQYKNNKDEHKRIYDEKYEDLGKRWDAILARNGVPDVTEADRLDAERCAAADKISNEYLLQLSRIIKTYEFNLMGGQWELIHQLIYWNQYLNPTGTFEVAAYGYVLGYISVVSEVAHHPEFILTACQDNSSIDDADETAEAKEIKPKCNFNMGINLVVADVSMDCEKFEINVNAGVSLSAEKNFTKKETTLAIGIGLGTTKGGNIPVVNIEAKAGVSQQLYILFDKNNRPSDIGMKLEIGASAGMNITAGPLSTEVGSAGASAGYTLGLNSGWDFN
jgi:hypothetical protein